MTTPVGDFSDEKNPINETFFLTFVGEHVELAGSFYHSDQEAAIKVQGYILDIDDEYYYLGDTPEEITNAIKRDRVIYIQVIPKVNEYQQMLMEMDVPETDEEKN